MMRRILTVLAVVAAAVLVAAGVAVAQEDTQSEPEHADRPGPVLIATGDGSVSLDVERGGIRLYVVGDVSIEGPANLDVVIESFEGPQPALSEGGTTIELENFSGSVFIRGIGYTVDVEGHVALHGHGIGTATLDGEGLWKTRSGKGTWPAGFGFGE